MFTRVGIVFEGEWTGLVGGTKHIKSISPHLFSIGRIELGLKKPTHTRQVSDCMSISTMN